MFYVEINLESLSGDDKDCVAGCSVNEAKIHHIDAMQENKSRTVVRE